MKCLLVDDSRTMRTIQRKILAALPDMEFAEAGDGVEALAAIAASPGGFDVILIDWNMPNMNGISLVKKIRETDLKTLLIMATTEAESSRILEAVKAGANNYLTKPFTPDILTAKVTQTVAKAKPA